MILRTYEPEDFREVTTLFYETVHQINRADYSQEQVNAWAPDDMDYDGWHESLLEHETVVAVENGILVGFGDMDEKGYLDRLYVHKDYQRRGIAAAICEELEQRVAFDRYYTHASITARPFFEKRGYCVIQENRVCRRDVWMTNYTMEKMQRINEREG